MATTRRLRRLAGHLANPPASDALLALSPAPTALKPWQLPGAPPEVQAEPVDEDIDVLDYAYSFITNPGAHSPPVPSAPPRLTPPHPHC